MNGQVLIDVMRQVRQELAQLSSIRIVAEEVSQYDEVLTLETLYHDASVITVSCTVEPMTDDVYRAVIRRTATINTPAITVYASSKKGFLYRHAQSWKFTDSKNAVIRDALERQETIDALAELL